jgi:glycosyltransferase involved in cell wall biosynthesis
MKTLMLLNAAYPADIRVEKEANALSANGIEVHLLCLRRKRESSEERIHDLFVYRIAGGKSNYSLAFWDIVMSVFFIHPLFFLAAKKMIEKHHFHVLHVHDLPLAGTAFALRKKFPGLKVVVDFHENYPDALRTWFQWKKNPVARIKNRLFLNPQRWARYERTACHKADHVVAVVDEMKQRLIAQYNIPEKGVTVVTNSESRSFASQTEKHNLYDHLSGKFIVTYSGGIGPHRGVDTAIEGMALLQQYPIYLVIVGSGSPDAMSVLKKLVHQHQLTKVEFKGHQPFQRFYSIMHEASVNIIPHHANEHTNHTVPHKLFQSMLAAKPLLVSSAAPLKRIVEQTQSGLVFEAGNPADFAKQILTLYNDPQLGNRLSANAWKAAGEGTLNWETDQRYLIDLYRNL